MLPNVEWARIVAPLRAVEQQQEEEVQRGVCHFYGHAGCLHGANCKFIHIKDPEEREAYWVARKKRHQYRKKLAHQTRQLAKKYSEPTPPKAPSAQLRPSSPVFVPSPRLLVMARPTPLEEDNDVAPAPLRPLPTALDVEVERQALAYLRGIRPPRYALSEGHPVPCWHFAHDKTCPRGLCAQPHYKPRWSLCWRRVK